jgi:hypothetical protein
MSTTRLVGLLSVHGHTRCPSRGWYAEEPHDKGKKAVGFMVSITTGTGGDFRGGNLRTRAWLPVPGYGADRVWVEQHYIHNTGQSNSPRTVQRQQRPQREQTGREASRLKEVKKVKRVEESEKWVTRPRGGGGVKKLWRKKNFGTK